LSCATTGEFRRSLFHEVRKQAQSDSNGLAAAEYGFFADWIAGVEASLSFAAD
jgi:hypothetical protein